MVFFFSDSIMNSYLSLEGLSPSFEEQFDGTLDILREVIYTGYDAQVKWTGVISAFRNLNITPEVCVDVGSGKSPLAIELKKHIPTVYAVDYAVENPKNAENGVEQRRVDFFTWDELAPESVDLVVDAATIHENPHRFFEKIASLLKPGGHLISSVDGVLEDAPSSEVFMPMSVWVETAKKYGLELITPFDYSSLERNPFHYHYSYYDLYIASTVFQKV
jgi:SAM-dependent methyltransferase